MSATIPASKLRALVAAGKLTQDEIDAKVKSGDVMVFNDLVPTPTLDRAGLTAADVKSGQAESQAPSLLDSLRSIGNGVSLGDVVKGVGGGLLSAVPSIAPTSAPQMLADSIGKVSSDVVKEIGRGNGAGRVALRQVPVIGDFLANLSSPSVAYGSGRAPSKAENLDVADATGQLAGVGMAGSLASRAMPEPPVASMRVNMIDPRPSAPGPPVRMETIPVESSAPPGALSSLVEYLAREAAGKVPGVGTLLADKLKGQIARPRVTMSEIRQPSDYAPRGIDGMAPPSDLIQMILNDYIRQSKRPASLPPVPSRVERP